MWGTPIGLSPRGVSVEGALISFIVRARFRGLFSGLSRAALCVASSAFSSSSSGRMAAFSCSLMSSGTWWLAMPITST